MSDKIIDVRLRHAAKTEAEWISANPVLLKGELAFSTDKGLFKQGDGTSSWSALSYNLAGGLYGLTATIKELNYVKGVTSDIQTQLNNKVPTSRKVNGKELSADISLSASDVGADVQGAADSAISTHNSSATAHSDIRELISGLQEDVDNAASASDLSEHINDTIRHITSTERTNWDAAKIHADSIHARTDATKTAKSTINGNILINGTEVNVYIHPAGTNPHGTTKADVGLGNVDNTSDINKPVSTAQQAAIDKVLSDAKSYTDTEVADLINGAPETLDTLKEISDAMASNEGVMDALNAAIGNKQDKITGAASTIVSDNLIANRVVISDGNGKIGASTITTTKLGYLSNVTSDIQAQLNTKVDANHNHDDKYVNIGGDIMTGDLTLTGLNADRFINFAYEPEAGYDWRLGHLGSGAGDANYFVIQNNGSTGTYTNVIRIGFTTLDVAFGGNIYPLSNTKTLGIPSSQWANVYATNFTGNLLGNADTATKLSKAKSIESVSALDEFIDSNRFQYATMAGLYDLTDGIVLSAAMSSAAWGHQIYLDDSSYTIAHRYRYNSAWQPWVKLIDENNIASYLSGSYTQHIVLTKQCQITSYRKSVIALCKTSALKTGLDSYSSGTLTFHRVNGLAGCEAKVDVFMSCQYDGDGIVNVSIMEHQATSDSIHIKPCTFTYNGVNYGGLEVYLSAAEASVVTFDGTTNFEIFGLDYYNTSTSTAIITEINNSIQYDKHYYLGYNFINGNRMIHAGNYSSYALPIIGGTASGNIGVLRDGIAAFIANNHNRQIRMAADGNNIGLYDINNSLWIVYADANGAVHLNGNATTSTKASSLKYGSTLTTDEAINGFLEANTFKSAIWSSSTESTSRPGVTNGIILSGGYTSTTYGFQLAIDDDPTYYMALRQKTTDGWKAWKRIPMGDGTGASGTWNISISGTSPALTNAGHISTTDALDAFLGASRLQYATMASGLYDGLTDGMVLGVGWQNTSWGHQIYLDDSSYTMAHRYKSSTTTDGVTTSKWSAWANFLDSTNYSTYAVKKSGDTMTGNLDVKSSSTDYMYVKAINKNGSVGIYAATNRGLYDFTQDKWIVYTEAATGNMYFNGNATTATTATNLKYFKSTSTSAVALDDTTTNCIAYTNGSSSILGYSDGALYKQVYNSAWVHEIYGDYRTGQIAVRGKNNGTWQAWRTILDSGNYNSYALSLSGGTMTGFISYKTANYTSTPIRVYDEGTTYGHTLCIGSGGVTIVGAGESSSNLYSTFTSYPENLYLAADGGIYFYSQCDSISNKKGMVYNSNGYLYPETSNTGYVGTSGNKWAGMYASTFYGDLEGNAKTATALTSSAGSATKPIYFSGGKPVACSYSLDANIVGYAGSLATGGWKTLGGMTSQRSIYIAYNNSPAEWNSSTYSASIVFGVNDTKGLVDCSHSTPIVTFGGGYVAKSTDNSPVWYFKISGTSGKTYTMPSESGTLTLSNHTHSQLNGITASNITTAPGTGVMNYRYNVNNGTAGLFNVVNNANAIITLNKHSGNYDSQLGFSSDGNIYYRSFNGSALNTTASTWKTILDSGNYSSFALPLSGGTLNGNLRVNATIFGYRYGSSSNAPAFVFDKPGGNYTGIGANGVGDTIFFGAVNSSDFTWNTSYKQKWVFNGSVTADSFTGTFSGNSSTSNVAAKLGRGGDVSIPMTFNWSGQGGQPTWLWGGNDGVNMYVYNPSNFSVASASLLNNNSSLTYGASGLQYFNTYVAATSGASVNAVPVTNQWTHIIRMNYGNSAGYFADLALPLNYDFGMQYRVIQNGSEFIPWRKVLDSSNYSSYALPLTGGTLTGMLGTNSNYIIKPKADYRTTSSTHAGAITIKLPAGIGNTMVSMWIDVYNYSTNTSFTVHCGGYTYNNSTWANSPFAMVYGADYTVRLGHNGTNFVIYIGETTTTWSYPQVSVRNVTIGYTPTYANWVKDWSISFSTSFSNVTSTHTHKAITSKNIASQSVSYATQAGQVTGSYTGSGGQQNPNYFGKNKVGFLMMNTTVNGNAHYKDWMIMDCYSGSDVGGAVAIGVNRQALGAYIMRSAATRTSWAESAELLHTANYSSYALPKGGGTMTGSITMNGNRIGMIAGIYNTAVNSRFSTSALEIRENGLVAGTQSDIGYAPAIGFHWGNVCAGQLVLQSTGIFAFVAQGGGWAPLRAGSITGDKVYNAVWNDYAEYFERGEVTEAGDIVALDLDSDEEKYIKAVNGDIVCGIHSDSYGHLIGGKNLPDNYKGTFEDYNNEHYIPVGMVGRVYCKVIGTICKGDAIYASDIPGVGIAQNENSKSQSFVGYACESYNSNEIGRIKVLLRK